MYKNRKNACKEIAKVLQSSHNGAKRWLTMAGKTANVTARIQPEVKERAETILGELGIPVSVFIDMTYRQVIAHNGIPFQLNASIKKDEAENKGTINQQGS